MDTMPAPPAPPVEPTAPPKRHMAHWKIIVATAVIEFVALGILGVVADIGKQPTAPIPVPSVAAALPIPSETPGITAEMVVDAIAPEKINLFCNSVALVGDNDAAEQAFAKGYHSTNPSAQEVFDELLTRC